MHDPLQWLYRIDYQVKGVILFSLNISLCWSERRRQSPAMHLLINFDCALSAQQLSLVPDRRQNVYSFALSVESKCLAIG